jgi:MFS family permease
MRALRGRDFRNLWTAGLVSDAGDWLLLVALPILVYQLTGSTLGTALAFLVELAPPILLGAVAGRLADRWDRRRALMWVSVAQAAALLPLLAVGGRDDLWIVYAVITAQAALATLFDPSKNALLPTLVPADELVGANSLLAINANLGRLVGGPLGGALLALGDLRTIVAVDALSFGLAALLISRVRPQPSTAQPASPSPDAAPASGSGDESDASRRRVRAGLLMTGIGAVAQGLFAVLFVPFVARVLHGDAAETGLLRGVQAVGAIAAALLLGALARRSRASVLAATGAGMFGLLGLVIWNAPRVTLTELLYVVLFAAVGAPGTVMVTGLMSALQEAAPAATRGRVFGAFTAVFAVGQAIGMVAAGLLGDRVGVVAVLNVQGFLYLLTAVIGALGLASRSRSRKQRRPLARAAAGG